MFLLAHVYCLKELRRVSEILQNKMLLDVHDYIVLYLLMILLLLLWYTTTNSRI